MRWGLVFAASADQGTLRCPSSSSCGCLWVQWWDQPPLGPAVSLWGTAVCVLSRHGLPSDHASQCVLSFPPLASNGPQLCFESQDRAKGPIMTSFEGTALHMGVPLSFPPRKPSTSVALIPSDGDEDLSRAPRGPRRTECSPLP